MSRKVWFQLVDNTGLPFKGCRPASVQSDGVRDIKGVCTKIHAAYDGGQPSGRDILGHLFSSELGVYENRAMYDAKNGPLTEDTLIEMRGGSVKDALIVEVPGKNPAIPRSTPLKDQEKIAQECSSLEDWSIGTVHEIPTIWRFMSELGGCTGTGEIFWRLEDKQVVSLIMDGWFRKSTPDNRNALANKKSILIGSPGIGKSTLLCLMAFYLVFKHKKNVLLYRETFERGPKRYLLYMTNDAVQVVCFSVRWMDESEGSEIYEALTSQIGVKNIWVLLDGFPYNKIPPGFEPFDMLATSQQVDLKSLEAPGSYCCLLPSWSKTDLMALGRLLYDFEEDEMETRFYYSGGSVRGFTMDTVDRIRRGVDRIVTRSEQVSLLVSSRGSILYGESQFDRLRRTFVENASEIAQFTSPRHWEQVIDSEYALRALSLRLSSLKGPVTS